MGVVTYFVEDVERCCVIEQQLRDLLPWILHYHTYLFPPGDGGERVIVDPDQNIVNRESLVQMVKNETNVRLIICDKE